MVIYKTLTKEIKDLNKGEIVYVHGEEDARFKAGSSQLDLWIPRSQNPGKLFCGNQQNHWFSGEKAQVPE